MTTYAATLPAVTPPLDLGTNKNVTSMSQPLQGLLDDFVLYDIALTAEGIAALAGGGVPGL